LYLLTNILTRKTKTIHTFFNNHYIARDAGNDEGIEKGAPRLEATPIIN